MERKSEQSVKFCGSCANERGLISLRPDHIHMLLEIPPKMSVSGFMGYLKGKSSLMIYEQFGDLKFKYRNREFWCRGYYVDTVGKNATKICEYIRKQLDSVVKLYLPTKICI